MLELTDLLLNFRTPYLSAYIENFFFFFKFGIVAGGNSQNSLSYRQKTINLMDSGLLDCMPLLPLKMHCEEHLIMIANELNLKIFCLHSVYVNLKYHILFTPLPSRFHAIKSKDMLERCRAMLLLRSGPCFLIKMLNLKS